nr:10765_t:CDS:2 [Entrophospora candida]
MDITIDDDKNLGGGNDKSDKEEDSGSLINNWTFVYYGDLQII